MRITLAAVGRARDDVFRDLYRHYAGRLTWELELREVPAGTARDRGTRLRLEADALLATIPRGARTIALDENGTDLDSRRLAGWIGRHRDEGTRQFCLLVGGPDGLGEAVVGCCDLVLSLGRVTWPHMLVRGLVAEQLYRSERILSGHPYHHG